jgi:hypothetical protein
LQSAKIGCYYLEGVFMMRKLPESVEQEQDRKMPYATPEIIYEGIVSTRAGSTTDPGPGIQGGTDAADPADLFG